jgi:hypothetical protein
MRPATRSLEASQPRNLTIKRIRTWLEPEVVV